MKLLQLKHSAPLLEEVLEWVQLQPLGEDRQSLTTWPGAPVALSLRKATAALQEGSALCGQKAGWIVEDYMI